MFRRQEWLKATVNGLGKKLSGLVHAIWALVIDSRWLNAALDLILNEADDDRRNSLIDVWLGHRFADLERINITAVLVAGVISSAFSWYNVIASPWSTKALWYCGLLFAMVSITTAGVHSAGLHRLGCHPDWHAKLRSVLGSPSSSGRWRPRAMQAIMWQTPNFMLKLSITCFLVGLIILIWDSAKLSGIQWKSDDTKVATLFTVAVGISLVLYVLSVLGIFFKTVM